MFSCEIHESFKNTFGGCFFTVVTTLLENTIVRNGKIHSHNKVSYNYLRSPTQADHNAWRPQYSHVFFVMVSYFSCGKFEKSLVTCNVWKPGLSIFSFLTKDQKSFKKQKFHTLFFKIVSSTEMKYNIIFMYDTYTHDIYKCNIKYNVEFFI